MPDESDFKNYKTLEDYLKTLEGSKYYHDLYLKAINHPIRREILKIITKEKKISNKELFNKLKSKRVIEELNVFNYNLDYLIKALCIKVSKGENDLLYYEITQSGQVIDWL
jgi:hypothetical protein